jgi:phosphoribosylformimino-5-aminoimidazole carboxamide ribotide isomerase
MILYPAIDIQNGECVRLRRGDFSDATVFSADPVARALEWQEAGAQALHVVDLDGAREGKPANLPLVEEIAEKVSIPVQYGGGIRDTETLSRLEQGPVARVIVGTSAVTDQAFLMEAVRMLDGRIIVSVDADRGVVTTHGWQERTMVTAVRFTTFLQRQGIENILYTDIERDGMMMGMNLEAVNDLAQKVDINIIASGGISSLDDLRRLKELGQKNITGVIVGRALYEGSFTVAEAREILDGGHNT